VSHAKGNRYQCAKCGHINYPNRTLCRKCRHSEFRPVALPKSGRLLTFTHLSTLPGDFDVPELTLGIVQLANGVRVTAQLDIPRPKLGMAVDGEVQVVRKDEYNKYHGFVFRAK
jgi:uncharacterized OB-fold protein